MIAELSSFWLVFWVSVAAVCVPWLTIKFFVWFFRWVFRMQREVMKEK